MMSTDLGEGKTEEELVRSFGGRNGDINVPQDSYYTREGELNFRGKESFWRDQKFESVHDAQRYLDDEDAYLKKTREQADQLLDLGIDAKLTERALAASEDKYALSTYPPGGGSPYRDPGERFRGEVKRMEDTRNDASKFKRQLDGLSDGFSMDERVELRNGWIRIPRIQTEYDKLNEEIAEESKKLREQFNIGYANDIPRLIEHRRQRVADLDQKKPKLFTGKWEKEHAGLEEEIKSLEAFQRKINQLTKERDGKKAGIELPKVSTYELDEELKVQMLSGTGREVLGRCREVAGRYEHAKMPAEVGDLCRKYEALRDRLGSSRRDRY